MLSRYRATTDGYEWSASSASLGTCFKVGDGWRVSSGDSEITLIAVDDDNGREVIGFDSSLQRVLSLRTSTSGTVALASNAADEVIALIAQDGSSGIMALDPDGSPLFYAGRSATGSLDVFVTDEGSAKPRVLLMAVLTGLEAHRVGPLALES